MYSAQSPIILNLVAGALEKVWNNWGWDINDKIELLYWLSEVCQTRPQVQDSGIVWDIQAQHNRTLLY